MLANTFETKEPIFHILVPFLVFNFRSQYIMIDCSKDKSGFNILKHKEGILFIEFYLLKSLNIHKYNHEHYKVYVQMRN